MSGSLCARLGVVIWACVVSAVFAVPPNAHGENGWASDYTGQCCYTTLEAGQVSPPQYFRARNIGTKTWTSSGAVTVHLGTTVPRDRHSSFYDPATWVSKNRAGTLDQSSVPVGGEGTFTFTVKAPSTPGTYDEHFAPVADGSGGSWMDAAPGWGNVFLTYTVLPLQAPVIKSVEVSPVVIPSNGSAVVAFSARDNLAIREVEVSLGGNRATIDGPAYVNGKIEDSLAATAQVSATGLGPGAHTLRVLARDRVGLPASYDTEVYVKSAQGGTGKNARRKRRNVGLSDFIANWDADSVLDTSSLRVVSKLLRGVQIYPVPQHSKVTLRCLANCRIFSVKRVRSSRQLVKFNEDEIRRTHVPLGSRIEVQVTRGNIGFFRRYMVRSSGNITLYGKGCLRRKPGKHGRKAIRGSRRPGFRHVLCRV